MEVKNIVFDPRPLFDPCQIFIDPRHLPQNFDTHQNFMAHATQNFMAHATHTKILIHATFVTLQIPNALGDKFSHRDSQNEILITRYEKKNRNHAKCFLF